LKPDLNGFNVAKLGLGGSTDFVFRAELMTLASQGSGNEQMKSRAVVVDSAPLQNLSAIAPGLSLNGRLVWTVRPCNSRMVSWENTSLPADSVRALASACGFTEAALPIDCAFATVGAIAQSTTSGSAEIKSRANVLVILVITLLPKKSAKP
jgi:hypothetical protein